MPPVRNRRAANPYRSLGTATERTRAAHERGALTAQRRVQVRDYDDRPLRANRPRPDLDFALVTGDNNAVVQDLPALPANTAGMEAIEPAVFGQLVLAKNDGTFGAVAGLTNTNDPAKDQVRGRKVMYMWHHRIPPSAYREYILPFETLVGDIRELNERKANRDAKSWQNATGKVVKKVVISARQAYGRGRLRYATSTQRAAMWRAIVKDAPVVVLRAFYGPAGAVLDIESIYRDNANDASERCIAWRGQLQGKFIYACDCFFLMTYHIVHDANIGHQELKEWYPSWRNMTSLEVFRPRQFLSMTETPVKVR